ncbi:metallophosphoesterase family protein [Candidatus Saganbacteria bacterium]|nr:metallophosphoesterase family protein [Candidatus Saganbacteria bacterium]
MARYGIIADVHSNWEALTAALDKLEGVDKIICLGDMVGYGPDPNLCLDKLRQIKADCIVGNHEAVLLDFFPLTWFNDAAREAIEWTQQQISAENLAFLKTLPQTLEIDGFQGVHGSLRQPLEEYVVNLTEAWPMFEQMTRPLCFIGHAHLPFFIAQKTDGNFAGHDLADKEEVVIDYYHKMIINPGGVGQPRDHDPRAAFGIYDDKSRIFTLQRAAYDVAAVQGKMEKFGLPKKLIKRLAKGS